MPDGMHKQTSGRRFCRSISANAKTVVDSDYDNDDCDDDSDNDKCAEEM